MNQTTLQKYETNIIFELVCEEIVRNISETLFKKDDYYKKTLQNLIDYEESEKRVERLTNFREGMIQEEIEKKTANRAGAREVINGECSDPVLLFSLMEIYNINLPDDIEFLFKTEVLRKMDKEIKNLGKLPDIP